MAAQICIGVIGGGSLFTPELVDLLGKHSGAMGPITIKLMDIDKGRQDVVGAFCQRLIKKSEKPLTIQYVENYEEAIKGSDYIFIQFRVGCEQARICDDRIGLAHRIPFVETLTVCGLASFLRTYYQMEIIAELVKKHAPDAWIMNFSNPSGVLTEALHKLGCKRVVGVCNGSMSTLSDYAEKLNADPNDLFMNWRGLNHLAFVDRVTYKGVDVFNKLVEAIGDDEFFPKSLIQNIGYMPISYLQYYYLKEKIVDKLQKAEQTRAEEVQAVNVQLFNLYKDENLTELPEELVKRGGFGYSRSVADLIKGIATNARTVHYAQIPNGSLLPELPPDAYVEVPVLAMDDEIRGIQVEPLPALAKGLVVTMKQYEQLLIQAAKNRSRRELLNAMLVNPLFGSQCLSEPILADILEANTQFLPAMNG